MRGACGNTTSSDAKGDTAGALVLTFGFSISRGNCDVADFGEWSAVEFVTIRHSSFEMSSVIRVSADGCGIELT